MVTKFTLRNVHRPTDDATFLRSSGLSCTLRKDRYKALSLEARSRAVSPEGHKAVVDNQSVLDSMTHLFLDVCLGKLTIASQQSMLYNYLRL